MRKKKHTNNTNINNTTAFQPKQKKRKKTEKHQKQKRKLYLFITFILQHYCFEFVRFDGVVAVVMNLFIFYIVVYACVCWYTYTVVAVI